MEYEIVTVLKNTIKKLKHHNSKGKENRGPTQGDHLQQRHATV